MAVIRVSTAGALKAFMVNVPDNVLLFDECSEDPLVVESARYGRGEPVLFFAGQVARRRVRLVDGPDPGEGVAPVYEIISTFKASFAGVCKINPEHAIDRRSVAGRLRLRDNPMLPVQGYACRACVRELAVRG